MRKKKKEVIKKIRKKIPIIEESEEEIICHKIVNDPGKNIIMPKRRTKEEYENLFGWFRKPNEPWTKKELDDYAICNAQIMFKNFGYRPWMQPFLNEDGSPKLANQRREIRKHRRQIIEL